MGALTSKLYTYKARPWEVKSIETISLANDPFLLSVKLDLLNKQILRVLPIISTEEWISDNTRFFVKRSFLKFSLVKISYTPKYLFESLKMISKNITYAKIDIQKAIAFIVNELSVKKNLTIISSDFIDIGTFGLLRKMDLLKFFYNFNFTNSRIIPVIPSYDDFPSESKLLCFSKENREVKTTFETKIISPDNYKNPIFTEKVYLNFNNNSLINLVEGNLYVSSSILFVINGVYYKNIPSFFNKIVIDKLNQGLFLNTIRKPELKKKNQLLLNLSEDLLGSKDTNIFSFGFNYIDANILLPTSLPINSNNVYLDLFGNYKKAYAFLLDKNIKNLQSLLGWFIFRLFLKTIFDQIKILKKFMENFKNILIKWKRGVRGNKKKNK